MSSQGMVVRHRADNHRRPVICVERSTYCDRLAGVAGTRKLTGTVAQVEVTFETFISQARRPLYVLVQP